MFEDCTEKLAENIYLYKNFISYKDCKDIVEYLEQLPESRWNLMPGRKDNIRVAGGIELIKPVRDKIELLLQDGYILGDGYYSTRMIAGDFWGVHSDVHDFEDVLNASNFYVEGMPYEEKELSIFGTIVYFNEADGGEIFYPKQNIVYKQNPGDLVIHSAGPETEHGVKEVRSGKRYAYSNNIRKLVKVPIIDKKE